MSQSLYSLSLGIARTSVRTPYHSKKTCGIITYIDLEDLG